MGCFFTCFGAKDNKILDFQPPYVAAAAKEHETEAIAKVVSRNQLSDLFASQEVEEISYNEKSGQFQSVDTQKCNDKVVVSDKLPEPDQTWTPPAKGRKLMQGFDSQEQSPTSCISDPPSASRNSVRTGVKSEKGNSYDTNKESLASQIISPSQKLRNGPAPSPKNLLSSGFKPVLHNKAGSKVNIQANRAANGRSVRSPRDRTVLRNVTAQWNEEVDTSRAPLKWWDGNGIPNSTNKYREDQIVSWDGTPFEERLEKALSEANSIAQSRKHVGEAFEDETDTAASQLHSLLHPESVVSFTSSPPELNSLDSLVIL